MRWISTYGVYIMRKEWLKGVIKYHKFTTLGGLVPFSVLLSISFGSLEVVHLSDVLMRHRFVVSKGIIVVVGLRLVELHGLSGDPLEVFLARLVQWHYENWHLVIGLALDSDFNELRDT